MGGLLPTTLAQTRIAIKYYLCAPLFLHLVSVTNPAGSTERYGGKGFHSMVLVHFGFAVVELPFSSETRTRACALSHTHTTNTHSHPPIQQHAEYGFFQLFACSAFKGVIAKLFINLWWKGNQVKNTRRTD